MFLWQNESGVHCFLLYGGGLYLRESVMGGSTVVVYPGFR